MYIGAVSFDDCLREHIESVMNCTVPVWDAYLQLEPEGQNETEPASQCRTNEQYGVYLLFYADLAVSSENEIYLNTGCRPKCKAGQQSIDEKHST